MWKINKGAHKFKKNKAHLGIRDLSNRVNNSPDSELVVLNLSNQHFAFKE